MKRIELEIKMVKEQINKTINVQQINELRKYLMGLEVAKMFIESEGK